MIIAGAKGLAKEVLEIFAQRQALDHLFFFDNVSPEMPEKLFDRFPVIRSMEEAQNIFRQTGDPAFTLGLGNPILRFRLQKLLVSAGGILVSAISPRADIGSFGNTIGKGCTILSGTVITNGVTIGDGCLINPNCTISHDTVIGNFTEISPGVSVTGNCIIGGFNMLGTNSVVIPGVKTGTNVVVGAGAVVTRDIADNMLVAGVPAREKRKLDPLSHN